VPLPRFLVTLVRRSATARTKCASIFKWSKHRSAKYCSTLRCEMTRTSLAVTERSWCVKVQPHLEAFSTTTSRETRAIRCDVPEVKFEAMEKEKQHGTD